MSTSYTCVLCANTVKKIIPNPESNTYEIICPNCGHFIISSEIWDDINILPIEHRNNRHIVAGYIREENDFGRVVTLLSKDIDVILKSAQTPKSLTARLYKLLNSIYRRTEHFGHYIPLGMACTALGYAKDQNDLRYMLHALSEMGFVNNYALGRRIDEAIYHSSSTTMITTKGLEKIETQSTTIVGNQCFVAMRFSEEMTNIYRDYIHPAVTSTLFECFRVDQAEHNEKICDRIIAEIRRSRFIIAEFTEQARGVYFEAGFAMGLGIPVIWVCRKEEVDKGELHFDVNHYNFITWSTGEELAEKLKNRIQATIPIVSSSATLAPVA